jgi:hypothetical protein
MSAIDIASGINALTPVAMRNHLRNNSSATVPIRLSHHIVSSYVSFGRKGRITVAAIHDLIVGDEVVVGGADQTEGNGTFVITALPSSTSFDFLLLSDASVATFTGAITAFANLWFRKAFFYGRTSIRSNNVGDVFLGPTAGNDFQPITIGAGALFVHEAAVGSRENLANWWLDVATATDGIMMLWV